MHYENNFDLSKKIRLMDESYADVEVSLSSVNDDYKKEIYNSSKCRSVGMTSLII